MSERKIDDGVVGCGRDVMRFWDELKDFVPKTYSKQKQNDTLTHKQKNGREKGQPSVFYAFHSIALAFWLAVCRCFACCLFSGSLNFCCVCFVPFFVHHIFV